jgi:N-acetylglucosaminyl-diphospho-decaprenol L-rhamnosyltransferase
MTTGILTISTVLFGGADTLARTIPTWIQALEGTGITCRFIDNSIDDGVEELIRAMKWGSVGYSFERHRTNPGFASSANSAVGGADTRWVFLLNPDVYLTPAKLQEIVGYVQGVDASGDQSPIAVSLFTDGILTCGISMDRLGYFSDRRVDSSRPCLGPSGGAAVFHRSTFVSFGGFDADLFAWGEDAGLAVRMYASGIRTHLLPVALEHEGGHSVASLTGQRFKASLLSRNRLWVIKRDFSRAFGATVGIAQLVMIVANGIRKIALGTGREHFQGVARGLFHGSQPPRPSSKMTLSQFSRYHRNGRAL